MVFKNKFFFNQHDYIMQCEVDIGLVLGVK